MKLTHELIRGIAWGKSYLWEVCFPNDTIEGFDGWFPATTVELPRWNIETHSQEFFMNSYEIPKSSGVKELKIEFIDTEKHIIHKWLRKWAETDILNKGSSISGIADIAKKVLIRHYDQSHNLIEDEEYYVIPKGSQFLGLNSDSASLTGMLDFTVVGGFWGKP